MFGIVNLLYYCAPDYLKLMYIFKILLFSPVIFSNFCTIKTRVRFLFRSYIYFLIYNILTHRLFERKGTKTYVFNEKSNKIFIQQNYIKRIHVHGNTNFNMKSIKKYTY